MNAKKYYKSILSFVLVLTMLFTTVGSSEIAYAASEVLSTEDIDGNIEETVNGDVFFVNKKTNKYVTVTGQKNDPIFIDETFTSVNDVKKAGSFTVYYGEYTNNGIDNRTNEVYNFISPSKNVEWAIDSNKDDVIYQHQRSIDANYKPSGWESVRLQHNDDGTVSFVSSSNEKIFTLQTYTDATTKETHTKFVVSPKYHLGDEVTDAEKFYMYSATKPKKARKVTLSNVAGDSVDVSWEVPLGQMYSSFRVLYSTSENSGFRQAGQTTSKTKMTVSGLKPNATYYFKVETFTNTFDTAYSSSATSETAYVTTLSASKPAKAEIVDITGDANSQTIKWNVAKNAQSYNIYRAEGRYGNYELIKSVKSDVTSYTDSTPNKSSKYKNYYKVQSVNGNVNGEMSEPYSLEIKKFGYNTYVFNDSDDQNQIAEVVEDIYQHQHYSQFGKNRYSFAFKPGEYHSDMEAEEYNVGYYTQVIGLGKTPYEVELKNVKTPAALANGNVTCNFWVNIENLTIKQTSENADYWNDSFKWAVSQAAPARRLNIERQTLLQWTWGDNAWASGGYIADSIFQGAVGSWCQQQYYYRNCEFTTNPTSEGAIYGVNWNQVVQGCKNVDGSSLKDNSGYYFNEAGNLLEDNGYTNWGKNGCTTVLNKTDEVREKPFLYFDTKTDEYNVFVPSVRKNTTGVSWSKDSMGPGVSLSLKSFYVANPDTDTAATINAALAKGYNLLLQPGIYKLEKALEITHENTIVLGLGMATLTSTKENTDTFIRVAGKKWNKDYTECVGKYDLGGVEIAGVILDAGEKTNTLLEMGYEGANVDHSNNPCVLQDVICRVGGTGDKGTTGACVVVNSNNTIIDQTWIWRADHGDNTGWTENTADNGLVVNGDDVSCYGLFVEHFQKYDILWRGENGKTFFLQNEKCYDPASQASWMSHGGTVKGFAAYKVTNNVKKHYAVGMGIYDVFINTNGEEIFLDNAIEIPNAPGVLIENACIVEIANGSGPKVGINHIINGTGCGITTGATSSTVSGKQGGYAIQRLLNYKNGTSVALPDYYDYSKDGGDGKEAYPIDPDTGLITTTDVKDVKAPSNDTQYGEKTIAKEPATVDNSKVLGTEDTTDSYFDGKIKDCTDEWDKIVKASEIKRPNDDQGHQTGEEGNGWLKHGIKVGLTWSDGTYNYAITSISNKAYPEAKVTGVVANKKKTLKTANIPATSSVKGVAVRITSVGSKSFKGLKKLTKVKFGTYVTKIDSSAFANCKKLKTISFKNVQTIGTSAFSGDKAIKKLTIGSKVTTIGKKAFKKCTKLSTITIGKKVKTIKSSAFASDNKIKKITFKGKVLKSIKKNAFSKKAKKRIKSKKTKLKGKSKSIKVFKKKLKIKMK